MKHLIATVLIAIIMQPAVALDADNDGIDDNIDNCLTVYNADQADADHDGYGNWCDGDFNNDGVVNFADLAVFRATFGSADAVTDLSYNGVVNFQDLARLRLLFGRAPGPSAFVACLDPGPSTTAWLSWNAPILNVDGSPLTDLGYFHIYHSNNLAAPKPAPIQVAASPATLWCLEPSTWYFVVTAVDDSGNESEFSNAQSKVIQ